VVSVDVSLERSPLRLNLGIVIVIGNVDVAIFIVIAITRVTSTHQVIIIMRVTVAYLSVYDMSLEPALLSPRCNTSRHA